MDITERKAQIAEFHTQFRNLVKVAPDEDTKRDLHIALNHFRNRYCQTLDQKKAAIIALLESGITSLQEIQDETRYRRPVIVGILRELVSDKKIQAVIYPISGRGRATKKYFIRD